MAIDRKVSRLCVYRRVLVGLIAQGITQVFSHQLAERSGVSAAQLRRDLMMVGYSGNPARGYDTQQLLSSIGEFLDPLEPQNGGLVGVGNLGRAILSHLAGLQGEVRIVAAFDCDPATVGRVFHGCPCHDVAELGRRVREQKIDFALVTVPAAAAQAVTDELVHCGVRGILNFAPCPLRAAEGVFVENIDMRVAMEKVAFFARRPRRAETAGGDRLAGDERPVYGWD